MAYDEEANGEDREPVEQGESESQPFEELRVRAGSTRQKRRSRRKSKRRTRRSARRR